MISCILAFYIAVPVAPAAAAGTVASPLVAQRAQPPPDPDALYAARDDPGQARRAAEVWQGRLAARPDDFDSAWKLARAHYWLGGHAPDVERRRALEEGIAAGRTAARLRPDRPEGHFWTAANMGALA